MLRLLFLQTEAFLMEFPDLLMVMEFIDMHLKTQRWKY